MTNQEFLLQLRSLRAQWETQQLTGIEYKRQLLKLHADHAAQYLVNPQGSQSAPAFARPGEAAPELASGLTHQQTAWAKGHDWYVSTRLDEQGWVVVVNEELFNTVTGIRTSQHREFRDYAALRAWAGY